MNVAVRPDGGLPAETTTRLTELGKWLAKNGETVFGTRPGPVPPQPWGLSLKKEENVFLHVFQPADRITFPLPDGYSFEKAELFGGRKVKGFGYGVTKTTGMVDDKAIREETAFIQLPAEARTPIDTVVVPACPRAPKAEAPEAGGRDHEADVAVPARRRPF